MTEAWEYDQQWLDFVARTREQTVGMIEGSAVTISLVPGNEPDIKYAVELGLTIMLDKPLIVVCLPGQAIPERLRRVADVVVEADLDLEEGQEALREALVALGIGKPVA